STALRTVRVQLELPNLADQSSSGLVVLVALGEPEAGPLIDVARGGEHAVGPQRDAAVAGLAGKAEGFLDEWRAAAEPARVRFDQEETQPSDLIGFAHQQDRADILTVSFGDPA